MGHTNRNTHMNEGTNNLAKEKSSFTRKDFVDYPTKYPVYDKSPGLFSSHTIPTSLFVVKTQRVGDIRVQFSNRN